MTKSSLSPKLLEFVQAMVSVGYDMVIQTRIRHVLVRGRFALPCGCEGKTVRALSWEEVETVPNLAEATSTAILAELESMRADVALEHSKADAAQAPTVHSLKVN